MCWTKLKLISMEEASGSLAISWLVRRGTQGVVIKAAESARAKTQFLHVYNKA